MHLFQRCGVDWHEILGLRVGHVNEVRELAATQFAADEKIAILRSERKIISECGRNTFARSGR